MTFSIDRLPVPRIILWGALSVISWALFFLLGLAAWLLIFARADLPEAPWKEYDSGFPMAGNEEVARVLAPHGALDHAK